MLFGNVFVTYAYIIAHIRYLVKHFFEKSCVFVTFLYALIKYVYEIRYRRNGYNVSASSKSLEAAKKKFTDKLAEETQNAAQRGVSARSVRKIAEEWFDVRKARISEGTYKNYRSYFERFIAPFASYRACARFNASLLLIFLPPLIEYQTTFLWSRPVF